VVAAIVTNASANAMVIITKVVPLVICNIKNNVIYLCVIRQTPKKVSEIE
jgi:hypothetical protein